MKLLLDTHIWIWYSLGHPKLLPAYRASIANAPKDGLVVSVISVWEISMLVHYGKLDLPQSPSAWIKAATDPLGIDMVTLTANIALESYMLPGKFHMDPADRMIIATAREQGLTLITQDKTILNYARKGHVSVAP